MSTDRSHLTPKRITDKNGKITTVYVKDDAGAGASSQKIRSLKPSRIEPSHQSESNVVSFASSRHLWGIDDDQAYEADRRAIREGVPVRWQDGKTRLTPRRLTHLTRKENVEQIMREGLRPGCGELSHEFEDRDEAVYMFGSEESAHFCVTEGFFVDMGDYDDEVVMLEVDATQVPEMYQVPDRSGWEWRSSATIPPSAITESHHYDMTQVLFWDD